MILQMDNIMNPFHNYANALPSPFTIICDTEADIRLMKDLCDECDAKLQFENTREGMIKILKDCDHEPNRFRSCTTCNLKVLEIRKKAEINCQHEGHTKENENLDIRKLYFFFRKIGIK